MLGIVQADLPGWFFHDLEHVHRRLAPASMVLLTLIIVINLCRANNDGRAGTLGTARAKVLIRRGTSAVPHGSTGSSCGTAAACTGRCPGGRQAACSKSPAGQSAARPCYWQDARPGM
jgi:hypothetical protein